MNPEWDVKAREMGYAGQKELLEDLYLNDQLPIHKIAEKVGTSIGTITNQMRQLGIDRRPRGGYRPTAKQRWKVFRADQRLLYSMSDQKVARLLGVSDNLVYKYKRDQRRQHHADGDHQSDIRT